MILFIMDLVMNRDFLNRIKGQEYIVKILVENERNVD